MGIFTTGAKVLSARDVARADAEELARQRQREEDERAQAEEERQIRHALLLGQMEQSHVVPNAQRDQITVGGAPASRTMGTAPTEVRTRMVLPSVPDLITRGKTPAYKVTESSVGNPDDEMRNEMQGAENRFRDRITPKSTGTVAQPKGEIRTQIRGAERRTVQGTPSEDLVDPERYQELGQSGYSLDRNPGPSIIEQRKKAEQQTKLNQRVAALRARHPDRYGKMNEQELIGIVSDDDAYREALKEVKKTAPARMNTSTGIKVFNETTGKWDDSGYKAPPAGTAGGDSAEAKKQHDRDALQDRIGIVTQQISQLQRAMTDAPYVMKNDTSASAESQRKAKTTMQQRVDALMKEQEDLTKQLEKYSGVTQPSGDYGPTGAAPAGATSLGGGRSGGGAASLAVPAWAKGIRLSPQGTPEGFDLSAAAQATQLDQDRKGEALKRIRTGTATLQQTLESPYVPPAVKALVWLHFKASGTP